VTNISIRGYIVSRFVLILTAFKHGFV